MMEMYGNEQTLKDELVEAALQDDQVSQSGKNWLKENFR